MVATPISMAKSHITKWVKIQMSIAGKNQSECAEKLFITQPAFSNKLKNGSFTAAELIVLSELFQSSKYEVANLFWLDNSDSEGRLQRW